MKKNDIGNKKYNYTPIKNIDINDLDYELININDINTEQFIYLTTFNNSELLKLLRINKYNKIKEYLSNVYFKQKNNLAPDYFLYLAKYIIDNNCIPDISCDYDMYIFSEFELNYHKIINNIRDIKPNYDRYTILVYMKSIDNKIIEEINNIYNGDIHMIFLKIIDIINNITRFNEKKILLSFQEL